MLPDQSRLAARDQRTAGQVLLAHERDRESDAESCSRGLVCEHIRIEQSNVDLFVIKTGQGEPARPEILRQARRE